jgi:hypothetical protein
MRLISSSCTGSVSHGGNRRGGNGSASSVRQALRVPARGIWDLGLTHHAHVGRGRETAPRGAVRERLTVSVPNEFARPPRIPARRRFGSPAHRARASPWTGRRRRGACARAVHRRAGPVLRRGAGRPAALAPVLPGSRPDAAGRAGRRSGDCRPAGRRVRPSRGVRGAAVGPGAAQLPVKCLLCFGPARTTRCVLVGHERLRATGRALTTGKVK